MVACTKAAAVGWRGDWKGVSEDDVTELSTWKRTGRRRRN